LAATSTFVSALEIPELNARASTGIEFRKNLVLAHEDVARMADLAGERVLGWEPAPVVGQFVRPVGLHLAVADAADEPAAQHVGVPGVFGLARRGEAVSAPFQRPLPGCT